jgi:hypothetical protein
MMTTKNQVLNEIERCEFAFFGRRTAHEARLSAVSALVDAGAGKSAGTSKAQELIGSEASINASDNSRANPAVASITVPLGVERFLEIESAEFLPRYKRSLGRFRYRKNPLQSCQLFGALFYRRRD